MISIIVPVYKVEKHLYKCVESIQAQTYSDFEIILIDDGSPDKCPQICDDLAKTDKRIKVVHKENGGLSSARNVGLDKATGEYITFVDSDDTINSMMIERLFDAISTNNADISMCGCRTVTDNGKLLAIDSFEEGHIFKSEELISRIIFPLKTASWNKLFKRSVIKDCRFPEGKIHGEDLVFLMDIINESTKLVTVEYNGYNYFKRGNSITTSSFNNHAFDEVWCKDKAAQILIQKFPTFEKRASLWRLRARMNIIRSISKNGIRAQYLPEIAEYENYISSTYNNVKCFMCMREYVEIFLYQHIRFLYNLLLKIH